MQAGYLIRLRWQRQERHTSSSDAVPAVITAFAEFTFLIPLMNNGVEVLLYWT